MHAIQLCRKALPFLFSLNGFLTAIKTVSIANVLINAALSNLLSLIQKLDEAIDQMLENQVFIELKSQSQYKF